MRRSWKVGIALLAVLAGGIATWRWHRRRALWPPIMLKGAVLVRSTDVDKQVPIPGVKVSVAGLVNRDAWSTPTGFFALNLDRIFRLGQPIILEFRHPDYQPLDVTVLAGDRLDVVRMIPLVESSPAAVIPPSTFVSDIRIRYLRSTVTMVNVGGVAKTFHVINAGNVPCQGHEPCSPDGRWKAAVGSATLTAPDGNVFANARVSCIAGPCPFTKISFDGFSAGGSTIRVDVLNWSTTTTFLFEAEVFHSMTGGSVSYLYPVIFGRTLHFTVPAGAEGLCVEAGVNGQAIVFPLGPDPVLSWATCTESVSAEHTDAYQCELKPGYGFK